LRFISGNLLRVHVSSAYRPDQSLTVADSDRESDEQRTTSLGSAHGDEPVLQTRVPQVRRNAGFAAEQRLDLDNRYPMLLTVPSVGSVPIEP
jgi:hypothetical protein